MIIHIFSKEPRKQIHYSQPPIQTALKCLTTTISGRRLCGPPFIRDVENPFS